MKHKWIFDYRGVLAALPVLLALFWPREGNAPASLVWPLGLGLIFCGVVVRVWAQSYLHHRLERGASQLTTGGPYRMVRNPLYIGNTLIFAGATVFSKLLWMVPIAAVWCVVMYTLTIRWEEKHLANQYGQPYLDYLASVPRWLPRLATLNRPDFINQHLGKAVMAEMHNWLIVIPFLLKQLLISPEHSLLSLLH